MSKRARITSRKRVVVHGQNNTVPFWLEHLGGLIVLGLIVIVGAMVGLSLSDWGRAALVWLGLGLGVVMLAWLARDAWRSLRAGEPTTVWAGEAFAALGWGGMTIVLGGGMPTSSGAVPTTCPGGRQPFRASAQCSSPRSRSLACGCRHEDRSQRSIGRHGRRG